MRVYTVHERPWSSEADRDAVLVRDGFSWLVFLFGSLGALAQGLFRAFLLFLAAEMALALIAYALEPDDPTAFAALLGSRLAFGFLAPSFKRAALARAGLSFAGVIAAPDRAAAEHRYFLRLAEATGTVHA